ncbi:MAG TPA: 30S ribosomal protein S8 [Candidatus Polarisedimenticolia bacterium]|nr:30S ribosomal protein S8 [Candidatus Polarisedimenticolia bacterium]
MVDPIADFLTRIRNAVRAGHPRVEVPHSRTKQGMAELLQKEGYVGGVSVIEKGRFKAIRIDLRYDDEGQSFITGLTMVSRPGRRIYAGHEDIPPVMGGLGLNIVSTPRGLMSGRQARKAGVGGEILCNVW